MKNITKTTKPEQVNATTGGSVSTNASTMPTPTPTPTSTPTTTAIVYLTRALDECRFMRLSHLLQTLPPNIDVWLLHNHNMIIDNHEKLTTSIDLLRRLEREHVQLYNSSQANQFIPEFDDKSSGPAKSSFLRWVVQHPEYKYVWHMEDDILFTGEWRHFFSNTTTTEADFIGAQFDHVQDWGYFQGDRCSMDQQYIHLSDNIKTRSTNTSLSGRIMCRDVLTWRTLWSIARVSTQFAQFLLEDIESGLLHGHHEAVVQGLLMGHSHMTFQELPPLEGFYIAGGWGMFQYRMNCSLETFQPIQPNRYYHPVKCEAYPKKKFNHFKELMMTYGWSNTTDTQ